MDEKEIHNKSDKETSDNDQEIPVENDKNLEEKLKDTEEKLLRSLAEIENQRRRFEKEIGETLEYGGFNFAKETLALLDNLTRAKMSIKNDVNLKDSKDLNKFLEYFEILEKDLISTFEKNKIKKIDCLNKKFDPNFHQAMLEIEDNEKEAGMVVQEVQPGYMFSERLLRPSFVGISKKKASKNDKKD